MVFIFDENHSHSVGISIFKVHYFLLILLSLTVVVSLKAVGMILVIAMLIAPGAIGFLLTNSFRKMLLVAVSTSVICSIAAVYLSFFIDSAPAPTIIVLLMAAFILCFIYKQFASVRVESAKA